MKYFIVFIALIGCSTTPKPSDLSQKICQDLNQGKSFSYKPHYSEHFQKSLPVEQMATLFDQVKSEYGDCQEVIDFKRTTSNDKFSTRHSSGKILDFTIVDSDSVATGLWLHGERAKPIEYANFEAAKSDFEQYHKGTLYVLENDKTLVDLNSNDRTALGSIFKLFVLDALLQKIQERKAHWGDNLSITRFNKSLPSGTMQNEKEGESFELREYAKKMISISDNTATDHLIDFIGKSKIERRIKSRGLQKTFGWSRPFLTTMELFKIRATFSPIDYKSYAGATRTNRMLMLQKLPKSDDKKFLEDINSWQQPRGLYDAEWFSTPQEICTLLFSLDKEEDPELVEILGSNIPFVDNEKYLKSFYKGGSEPGLVQMAYLLKNETKTVCLYAGAADLSAPVDEMVFFERVKAVLKLL
tara:strand:- start:31584 stop:32825 length:1242 start_codon:yes stop_codon:yes gene_type:complete